MITIEQHKGVNVLRDDLLTGGTIGFLKEMCPYQIIDKSTITL